MNIIASLAACHQHVLSEYSALPVNATLFVRVLLTGGPHCRLDMSYGYGTDACRIGLPLFCWLRPAVCRLACCLYGNDLNAGNEWYESCCFQLHYCIACHGNVCKMLPLAAAISLMQALSVTIASEHASKGERMRAAHPPGHRYSFERSSEHDGSVRSLIHTDALQHGNSPPPNGGMHSGWRLEGGLNKRTPNCGSSAAMPL